MQSLLRFSLVMLIAISTTVSAQEQKSIEFNHLFDNTFASESIQSVRWMNDGRYYTAVEDQRIVQFNIVNGEERILFDGSAHSSLEYPSGIDVQGYEFSENEELILIKTDVEQLWRRSTKEFYFVYEVNSNSLTRLSNSKEKQQYAELSPDGNKAAFVQNNNLFWVDLASGTEIQITEDGAFNFIINGAADWVYEEEFGFAKAWFWSPKGNRIAFYRFDETEVNEFFMTEWGALYPNQEKFKYPKAGEINSTVSIHVFDLNTKEITRVDIGEEKDQYIPRINWTLTENRLAIRRMNRLQNKEELLFADVTTGTTKVTLTETSTTWLDVHDNLHFLKNGKQFITTSEKSGFNHVYLYNLEGEELRQITKGEYDVTQIVGFDEKAHNLYYMSTEHSPLERHFYRIRVDGKRKKEMTTGDGWYSINMSKDFKYYLQTHSDYNTPSVITLHEGGGKQRRILLDNNELSAKLDEYAFSTKEFMQLEVNGASLNAFMIKPIDFDETKKYPVLMYVYGGPGSQTVTRQFSSAQRPVWHQYLANQGYIIVSVDNRGTGARGVDFKKQTYKKLGILETEDQVSAAKELAKLSFVNEDRIGIWGWSYGGYMSSLSLAEGNNVFKTAIAVAPVTHWKYYDTIYTERFMQTPQLNPEGYENGSPMNKVEDITGNYLLIHGTGDDNVHFQNSVDMVDALIKANVQFETMFYPNLAHSISGGNARRHLYQLMTNFILEKL